MKGEEPMPFYLYQVGYTVASAKTLVEHPQNREDAAKSLIKSLGGKLHSFFSPLATTTSC